MKRYLHFRIFAVFMVLCGLLAAQQERIEAGVSFHSNLLKNVYMRKDTPADFNNFLAACPPQYKEILLKCLVEEIPSRESEYDASIRKALVWRSYSKATYMFRKVDMVEYHEILQWAANSIGIDDDTIEKASTYTLERAIVDKSIGTKWDGMSFKERIDNGLDIYITSSSLHCMPNHRFSIIWYVLGYALGYALEYTLPYPSEIMSFIIAVHAIKTEHLMNN